MNMKRFFLILFAAAAIAVSGCSKSSGSWAYQFVTYNGNTYIVTGEKLSSADKQIGAVKYYSDHEGKHQNSLFSNYYKVGTALYSIKGVITDEAISAKTDDGSYIKLINKSKT